MSPSLWQRLTGRGKAPAWREHLAAAYAASDARQFAQAAEWLAKAAAAVPAAEKAHVLAGLPDERLEGFAKVAVSAVDYGDFATAERLLQEAEALGAPTAPLADAWAKLAENAAFLSQWPDARKYLDKAVAIHPGRIMPHHLDLPDMREGE